MHLGCCCSRIDGCSTRYKVVDDQALHAMCQQAGNACGADKHLWIRKVCGVMVHPQHIDAHFGASWKLEPAQFGFFTTLPNLHRHPKCIQQCTQRSESEDAQEANMSQAG